MAEKRDTDEGRQEHEHHALHHGQCRAAQQLAENEGDRGTGATSTP